MQGHDKNNANTQYLCRVFRRNRSCTHEISTKPPIVVFSPFIIETQTTWHKQAPSCSAFTWLIVSFDLCVKYFPSLPHNNFHFLIYHSVEFIILLFRQMKHETDLHQFARTISQKYHF